MDTPPTPEWIKKNSGNTLRSAKIIGTDKEIQDCQIKKYRIPYDLLDEMGLLTRGFHQTVDGLFRAHLAFIGGSGIATMSNSKGGGEGGEIRGYWLRILQHKPLLPDINTLIWLGSEIQDEFNPKAYRDVFNAIHKRLELSLLECEKIYIDWSGEKR